MQRSSGSSLAAQVSYTSQAQQPCLAATAAKASVASKGILFAETRTPQPKQSSKQPTPEVSDKEVGALRRQHAEPDCLQALLQVRALLLQRLPQAPAWSCSKEDWHKLPHRSDSKPCQLVFGSQDTCRATSLQTYFTSMPHGSPTAMMSVHCMLAQIPQSPHPRARVEGSLMVQAIGDRSLEAAGHSERDEHVRL